MMRFFHQTAQTTWSQLFLMSVCPSVFSSLPYCPRWVCPWTCAWLCAWLPWILLSGATVAYKLTVQMPPMPGASVRALRPWGESWVGDHHCPLSAQDSVTSFASCSLVESRDCWITADGNLPHSHEGGLLTDSPVTPLGEQAFGHGYGLSARHRDPLVSIEILACSQVLF